MICEKSYYDENGKLKCNDKNKLEADDVFKDLCPLIYYCPISEKYENTPDMFDCIYRRGNDDGQ